jgi:hypothetical protein
MMRDARDALREFVELIIEKRMREADVSDGSRVPHGSNKHIKDLEIRIADLVKWRDRQKRGSEARANYARLINRLKGELSSAKRVAAKNKSVKESIDEQTASAEERWQALAAGSGDKLVDHLVQSILQAPDPQALAKAKRAVIKKMDNDELSASVTDGFVSWLYDRRKAELAQMNYKPRSSSEARADAILRIRDSSGRAKARK